MVENILGSFLLETGRVEKSLLSKLMKEQDETRVKLGLIAVSEGMMTLDQTNEVNILQSAMDQRFGDIAVAKGYLTDEQVGYLLKKQGDPYLTFVQTLIDNDVIKMDELDAVIEEFRVKNGFTEEQLVDFKSGDVNKIVPLFLNEESEKYSAIVGTIVRTLIRLVNRNTYIGKAEIIDTYPEKDQVSQGLIWEEGVIDSFSEGDGGLLDLCSIFAHEEFDTLDEDSLDAAGELLNCANGLYVSSLSRRGVFLEIMPPIYGKIPDDMKVSSICRIPVYFADKKLYYTVAEVKQL
jgi:hypothetical protein